MPIKNGNDLLPIFGNTIIQTTDGTKTKRELYCFDIL